MRDNERRYIVRGYCAETGDVHEFRTDSLDRWQDMARQLSEDLEDIEKIDRRAKLGISVPG